MEHMSNNDTEEERFFRERYVQELQKKKNQSGAGGYSQSSNLLKLDELRLWT